MPIYEHRCAACGHYDEVFKWYPTPEDVAVCPECGMHTFRLIVSVPAMHPDDSWSNGVYDICFGRHFRSKKELKEYAKRRDAAEVDSGWEKDVSSNRTNTILKAERQRKERIASGVKDMLGGYVGD